MFIDTNIHKQKNKKYFCRMALSDLHVYKCMYRFWAGEYHGWLYRTPFVKMPIKLGNTYNTAMLEPYTHNEELIYGFHSFTMLGSAVEFMRRYHENFIICECIIPRGSKYYHGVNHEIVSNKIIIQKPIQL